ncbi:DUF47 family protein [Synechococcus sp. RSCCF101]|uniref:DUF47 domain-containing protein n=1 Tax=Synechococcus sp. RSCCF101 TaxID=2511069 RepID=UPI0012483F13|nr:DUF47 family protein [Synechococcus sp. RSCCF101]QEY32460.1 DUF47 family protein [Synechococcus sp. RSCCF101]
MSQERPRLFGRTRFLVGQIDDFLDKLAEGAVLFERGLQSLIEHGLDENTRAKADQLQALKERCKELRRNVSNTLVSEMLIPDFRGDVLSLLSMLFGLLDVMGHTYMEFLIEHEGISETTAVDRTLAATDRADAASDDPRRLRQLYLDLVGVVVKSVLAAVAGSRAFFRSPAAVQEHINAIRIYENEADGIALRLKRQVFASSLSLERKLHLRDAIDVIDAIANLAEDISDELAVDAIKREL